MKGTKRAVCGWFNGTVPMRHRRDGVDPCGRRARGKVKATADTPAHVCKQCSPEHCQLRLYLIAQATDDRRAEGART